MKRLAATESTPEANDSAFRNKRIMAESVDTQRAEPSHQQSATTLPPDPQRGLLSRQHVRALNTQFASWVQSQLKNHPDELWEDGVQDYLSHASGILEKFSDVVNWLKAKSVKGSSLPALGSHDAEKKFAPEFKHNEIKLFPGKTGFTPSGASTSFTGGSANLGFTPGSMTTGFSSGSTSLSFTPGGTNMGFTAGSTAMNFTPSTTMSFTSGSITTNFTASDTTMSFTPGSATTSFSPSNTTVSFAAKSFTPGGTSFASAGSTTSLASNSIFTSAADGTRVASSSTSFGTLWSSGVFSNNQTPVLFGSQSANPANSNAADDVNDEDELPQPSSPSVKKSEEKGIVVVHEVKCKLYVKSTDAADKDSWKDKGTGQLSIRCKEGISKGSKESKPTIVVRNDVGKVLLNALLYPGIKTSAQKNSIVAIFHTSDDGTNNDNVVARTFLIRTKTEDDRNKLATAIQEYAPAS